MKADAPISSRSGRDGFTLVEVLLSFLIVAILVSLLFPFVRQAIDKAKTAQCLSNLRQIGMAFGQYAAEHDGKMPYYRPNGSPNPTWRTYLDPYLQWTGTNARSVRVCPFDQRRSGSSYAMNYGLPGPFWTAAQIPRPREGFLVGCIMPGVVETRLTSGMAEPGGEGLGYQHLGLATLLFIDGHVESRAPELVPRAEQKNTVVWNRFWNPSKP